MAEEKQWASQMGLCQFVLHTGPRGRGELDWEEEEEADGSDELLLAPKWESWSCSHRSQQALEPKVWKPCAPTL